MNSLSEQERNGLDDVFLSISSTPPSFLKWKISQFHSYLILHCKAGFKSSPTLLSPRQSIKNTLKTIILQKNCQKTEK